MAATRIYQEFEPATRWTSEPDAEILVVDLPGFKKEQIKVVVTTTRKLRLTGERPTGGNKWIRFRHEVPVPMTVDIDSVSAMFKDNKLYIRHSKVKTESPHQTKPPSPVVKKPHDQLEAKQDLVSKATTVEKPNGGKTEELKHDAHQKAGEVQNDNKELTDEPKGPLSSKDEEKDKVGAKLFEKYKEATGNVVKEAKSKRELLCNLAASIALVLLILLYARNAVRSSLVWNSEE
ncbi:HSP20-like chaperones superfamily protein [Hirschfeldia incana]|nr:HSP20-like chaperones superfamily protein [Hirschfeldia incana]